MANIHKKRGERIKSINFFRELTLLYFFMWTLAYNILGVEIVLGMSANVA